jgi:hypothetical protein
MSNTKKKAAKEVESAPAGPWETMVRDSAELLNWEVRYMPSLLTEPGYIKVIDPLHEIELKVNIRRGEACDDSLWQSLVLNSSLLYAQAKRHEDYPR